MQIDDPGQQLEQAAIWARPWGTLHSTCFEHREAGPKMPVHDILAVPALLTVKNNIPWG